MHNETSAKVKLNRFFNIFNPKVYNILILLNIMFLIWGIYLFFTGKQSVSIYIASAVTANIIMAAIMVYHCPKVLVIGNDTLKFDDYFNIHPKHIRVEGFCWLKVSYSVTELKDIQFHQNVVEKFFNVGRISFTGKATFTSKRDLDRIKEKDTFVIYGIKNFSDFKLNFLNK